MITTKRSGSGTSYSNRQSSTAVLEKPVSSYRNYVNAPKEESAAEASARMRENLQKLLNYDRYSETVVDSVAPTKETEEQSPAKTVIEEKSYLDEDSRPTSTTMQFGDDADADIRNEIAPQKTEEKKSVKLSAKGKIIIALYSVVVALIFALIVINTTMLSKVRNDIAMKQGQLSAIQTEYQLSEERLQELENKVPDKAEEFGMIK